LEECTASNFGTKEEAQQATPRSMQEGRKEEGISDKIQAELIHPGVLHYVPRSTNLFHLE
jgi:hypothetical protein